MMSEQHKIRTQILEVNAHSSQDTFMLHRKCSEILNDLVVNEWDAICQELLPSNIHLRLDSVVLDIGDVREEELEIEIPKRAAEKMRELLAGISADEVGEFDASEISEEHKTFELLEIFLKTGNLPWWSVQGTEASLELLMNEVAKANLPQLKEFLRSSIKSKDVRRRLAFQCSLKMIGKIGRWINSELTVEQIKKDLALIDTIERAPLENSRGLSETIIQDYLLRLSDNKPQRSSQEWFSRVINKLSTVTSSSNHDLIKVLEKSTSKDYQTDLQAISRKYLKSTKSESKNPQKLDSTGINEEILVGSEKEILDSPVEEIWPPQAGKDQKAKWQAFLERNLIHGIGSHNWIEKKSDQELEQILKSVDAQNVLEEFVCALMPILGNTKSLVEVSQEKLRLSIWSQTLKCGVSGLKESDLLHLIIGELAEKAKKPTLELYSTLYEEIRKFPRKSQVGSDLQSLFEERIDGRDYTKDSASPSQEQIAATDKSRKQKAEISSDERAESQTEKVRKLLIKLEEKLEQKSWPEIAAPLFQLLDVWSSKAVDASRREKFTRIILSESRFSTLVESTDFQTLAKITQAIDPSFVSKYVPMLQEFLTAYHNHEGFGKIENEHRTVSILETKTIAWRALWKRLNKATNENEFVEILVQEIAAASRISAGALVHNLDRSLASFEVGEFSFSSSLREVIRKMKNRIHQAEKSQKKSEKTQKNSSDVIADSTSQVHDTSSTAEVRETSKTFNSSDALSSAPEEEPSDDRKEDVKQITSHDSKEVEGEIQGGEMSLAATGRNELKEEMFESELIPEALESDTFFIENAGLLLLGPFLSSFFQNLNLLTQKHLFKNEQSQHTAIHLLQYLTTSQSYNPEYQLTLNKVVCGVLPNEPIPIRIDLTEEMKKETVDLLDSVITNWSALKNTSAEGFQTSFLQRNGKLSRIDGGWKLQVEEKPFDMLLEQLPWGISMCTLPWNNYLIFTEWHMK